jgi:hypothetical protein
MRSRILFAFGLLVSLALPACAAPEVAGPIPAFPKSQVMFEVNLTQKDFLPTIKQLLPSVAGFAFRMSGGSGDGNKSIGPVSEQMMASVLAGTAESEIKAAIAGLNNVSVLVYNVPQGTTMDQVAEFYMQKLGVSKWNRVIRYDVDKDSVRFYVKPDLESMFCLIGTKEQVICAESNGKIDLAAISRLVSKVMTSMAPSTTAPAAASTAAPAPAAK